MYRMSASCSIQQSHRPLLGVSTGFFATHHPHPPQSLTICAALYVMYVMQQSLQGHIPCCYLSLLVSSPPQPHSQSPDSIIKQAQSMMRRALVATHLCSTVCQCHAALLCNRSSSPLIFLFARRPTPTTLSCPFSISNLILSSSTNSRVENHSLPLP